MQLRGHCHHRSHHQHAQSRFQHQPVQNHHRMHVCWPSQAIRCCRFHLSGLYRHHHPLQHRAYLTQRRSRWRYLRAAETGMRQRMQHQQRQCAEMMLERLRTQFSDQAVRDTFWQLPHVIELTAGA